MDNWSDIRAVVFDLFHTLVSLELSGAPGRGTPEVLGIDPEKWFRAWLSDPDGYGLGLVRFEVPLRRLARQLNPRVTEAQIQEVMRTRSARFRHALLNVERDVITGLKRLRKKGYRLGLISNCGLDEIEAWPDSPLAQLLDTAVFSCQVGRRKPDPTIYSLAASRLGVGPQQCLYVGDGSSDEFRGAREAGMTPVLLTRHIEVIRPERIPEVAKDVQLQIQTVGELAGLLG